MSCYAGTLTGHLSSDVRAAILLLADAVRGEGVGGDDVCSGLDVEMVNLADGLGCGQVEDVVVADQRDWPRRELPPVETLCRKPESLNPCAHCPVHHEDASGELIPYFLKRLFHFRVQRYEEAREIPNLFEYFRA